MITNHIYKVIFPDAASCILDGLSKVKEVQAEQPQGSVCLMLHGSACDCRAAFRAKKGLLCWPLH